MSKGRFEHLRSLKHAWKLLHDIAKPNAVEFVEFCAIELRVMKVIDQGVALDEVN